ncbi:ash family protein [Salmonella enterica]|nr:ash family protein [Salmonella enterica]EJF1568140.1 ash family protein [Salmonella enterica]
MCLIKMLTGCYIFPAVTVLTAGRCNPLQLPATIGAVSAFFVVATIFAIVRHFMARCIHTGCTAYQIVVHSRMYRVTMSMVAQAGPTSVGPVSGNAGIATPVWAIASERCNSSDSMKFMLPEAAIMATTPTPKHPKSAIPQLSYDCRRKNRHSRKKSLRRSRVTGYSHSVAANSATGLRIPNDNSAPEHAAKACFLLPDAPRSMAVRAGASSEAPGSELPGNANPVRAATNGFASVDGSEKSTNSEDAIMATTPTPKHPKSAIPQLSYDCRRKLHRAQMVVLHLYVLNMDGDEKTMQLHIPYVLSYIHDDIKAVNKELISLGLFDKAMGKKRRK